MLHLNLLITHVVICFFQKEGKESRIHAPWTFSSNALRALLLTSISFFLLFIIKIPCMEKEEHLKGGGNHLAIERYHNMQQPFSRIPFVPGRWWVLSLGQQWHRNTALMPEIWHIFGQELGDWTSNSLYEM